MHFAFKSVKVLKFYLLVVLVVWSWAVFWPVYKFLWLKALKAELYHCLICLAGIDQYDRDSIINDFKNGTCKLLVATSVAARGLDVKQLMLVVNYSCPNHYEDYVHRAGRTGRAGNKVCTLHCLVWLVLPFPPSLLFDEVVPRDCYRRSTSCCCEECF